jgi:hypothetical protein
MKNKQYKTFLVTLTAIGATALAAQDPPVTLGQLKVFDDLPSGYWIVESGATPANSLFSNKKEKVCASASDIATYLSGGVIPGTTDSRAGAQAKCANGKTTITLNSALGARIELLCPGQSVSGVNFPDIKMTANVKREKLSITADPNPALRAWVEDNGVRVETKATYLGRDCPAG